MAKMAQIAKEAAARAEAKRRNKNARAKIAAEAARVGAERQARLLNAQVAAELRASRERIKKTRLELLSRPLLNRYGRPSAFNQKLREEISREQKKERNARAAVERNAVAAAAAAERNAAAAAAAVRNAAAAERERVAAAQAAKRENDRRKQVLQALSQLRGKSPRVVSARKN
jgi:colicin import membrane protein